MRELETGPAHRGNDPRLERVRFNASGETQAPEPVQDSDADTTLTPGAQVKLRVISLNEAGESVPSAIVETTAPLAEAADARGALRGGGRRDDRAAGQDEGIKKAVRSQYGNASAQYASVKGIAL